MTDRFAWYRHVQKRLDECSFAAAAIRLHVVDNNAWLFDDAVRQIDCAIENLKVARDVHLARRDRDQGDKAA